MPVTVARKIFDLSEMARNCSLSDDPEICYLFYLDAVKPA
jgi:hypothetical protein